MPQAQLVQVALEAEALLEAAAVGVDGRRQLCDGEAAAWGQCGAVAEAGVSSTGEGNNQRHWPSTTCTRVT